MFDEFEIFFRASCLAEADLFAGKLCAALDRQNPRDLYDVMTLLEEREITSDIQRAFVVYLASHSRPMNELLSPELKDIREDFNRNFLGMQREPVNLQRLRNVQEQLPKRLRENLTENQRHFLISVKKGAPDWDALGIDHLHELPGLQWKIRNIHNMTSKKHNEALRRLRDVLKV